MTKYWLTAVNFWLDNLDFNATFNLPNQTKKALACLNNAMEELIYVSGSQR